MALQLLWEIQVKVECKEECNASGFDVNEMVSGSIIHAGLLS